MKNNFLKNFIIIGGGTFISMFIGFITTPIITRAVDPNAYGEYSIFTLYSSIAVMILYLGMDQSLVRFFMIKIRWIISNRYYINAFGFQYCCVF